MLPMGAFLLVAKLFYSYTIRDAALKGATSYYGIFKVYSISISRKDSTIQCISYRFICFNDCFDCDALYILQKHQRKETFFNLNDCLGRFSFLRNL